MSILQEILLEEYDRCHRHRRVCQSEMKELPKDSEWYRHLKKVIRRINRDLRMLRRALGFTILRYKREKRKMSPDNQGVRNASS